MKSISPWAAAAKFTFADEKPDSLFTRTNGDFIYQVFPTNDSLWIMVEWPRGGRQLLRAAYAPDGRLNLKSKREVKNKLTLKFDAVIGELNVQISWPESEFDVVQYTTTLKPSQELFFPFWPKDIVVPGDTTGDILVQQEGTRSGLLYYTFRRPQAGSVLYLQNLTALADYCEQTGTSAAATVKGRWPEMGFSLPPTKDKPLPAGKEVIISDAIVVIDSQSPKDEPAVTRQFLDLLAAAYVVLPRPETEYHEWPVILQKGLTDLIENSGCWSQVKGKEYFNAYVCDYDTPPEIMVQLAVMLPLLDYGEWKGEKVEVMDTIRSGLPEFYDPKLKTLMRWLPAAEKKLKGEEEQKKPKVMDSWYLHHPMLNLSRLALKGDEVAKKLFLDSIGYVIKVAHKFKYQWPVFYQMETLEVLKAETQPGKGGEKDVAGLYAHVMLQAYELTKDKKYLQEAEKAARSLKGLGFELFYQANNTAFASGALLRLYKVTGKQDYLDLSYLCLANVFRNCRLWDCEYGYGKHFQSFFTMFPLNDAPYSAVYEEQEVFCAMHDFLKNAEGVDLLPSLRLLVTEYIRYLVSRAVYYYPTMLPKDIMEEEPKVGELDPNLWIALEDLHDGWEKSGSVGQEVYGAGNAFGILPRHYFRINGEDWMIFCDYPLSGFKNKGKSASFQITGDPRLTCRLAIVPAENKLPAFTVKIKGQQQPLKGKHLKNGHWTFEANGAQRIQVSWT